MTLTSTPTYSEEGLPACRVATDDIYDLPYERLLATAEPVNWSRIMPYPFTDMRPQGVGTDGWTRVIEHGQFWFWRHRTPLKFWKSLDGDGYLIDYKLDPECDPELCDHAVTVDDGYIWVVPKGDGVRVRTVKVWTINGINPWFASRVVPFWGWTFLNSEFFHNAAALSDPVPFTPSVKPPWEPFPFNDGDIVSEY